MAVQKVVEAVRSFVKNWLNGGTGKLTYRVTQMFTGHGCFGEYLCQIKKEPTAQCHKCESASDSAQHTLAECPEWNKEHWELVDQIGADLSLEAIMLALASRDEAKWQAVAFFCEEGEVAFFYVAERGGREGAGKAPSST